MFLFSECSKCSLSFREHLSSEQILLSDRVFLMTVTSIYVLFYEEYMCHCYLRQDGLGAVIVTDKEYPARVAFNLETKLLDDFDTKYMCLFQNFYNLSGLVGRMRRRTTNSRSPLLRKHFKTIKIQRNVIRLRRSTRRSTRQRTCW